MIHKIPAGVEVKVAGAKQEIIEVSGIDKQMSGPGRRRDPRLAPARALPGQGHPLPGRIHPPQGRQEEVRRTAMLHKMSQFDRRKRARAPLARQVCRRAAAAVRAPLLQAHLRAGDRRREGQTVAAARAWRRS